MELASTLFPVQDYDLAETLRSGQAFRWREIDQSWHGVIAGRWVRLRQTGEGIHAEAGSHALAGDWQWLVDYLQPGTHLQTITASFPDDAHMKSAVAACAGLRLLKQEPWECLASFILSSTKQIVQIQQIVQLLCERFGDRVLVPAGLPEMFAFPSAARLAGLTEQDLRECKMGFRAPYLRESARMAAQGEVDLDALRERSLDEARAELLRFPGVGRKVADCVLLFAYHFQGAFPVDVWVLKALRMLYFPKRRPSAQRLQRFTETYFGPNAGYAQQYLFHYMRTQIGRKNESR